MPLVLTAYRPVHKYPGRQCSLFGRRGRADRRTVARQDDLICIAIGSGSPMAKTVHNGGSARFARDEGRSRTVTRSVRPREPERRSERLRAAPTAEGRRHVRRSSQIWFARDARHGDRSYGRPWPGGGRGYRRPGRLRSLPDGHGGTLRGQAGGPGAPPEIQTDACAGSSVRCTVPSRSARTPSSSTASCNRAANAATVCSALYWARLNRRSTTRCIRCRSGLNSAAAASVDPATATGDVTVSTRVASSTRPAYTPSRRPVTIAYASVRLMIQSISYSRYFKMATPRHPANAKPKSLMTLVIAWT